MYALLIFAAFLRFASPANNVAAPLVVPFNTTHYFGYDGPWQAIPVLVSEPQQLVNLYPGGTYATCIPSIHVANYDGNYTSDDFPTVAGIYDLSLAEPGFPESTEDFYIAGPNQGGVVGAVGGSLNGGAAAGLGGDGLIVTDQLTLGGVTVNNVSISAVYQANYSLPDGQHYPLDVGFLSLGAANNQFFDDSEGNTSYVGYMVPLNLSATGIIPSNTFGLHIGSVFPSVEGSLVLGGYDRSRVVGPVSSLVTQNELNDMIINLLDISIEVAEGGSPFSFSSKSGLLLNSQGTGEPVLARPNPTVPYLYLPPNTCEAITATLPVDYQPDLDLYIWNTSSPAYKKIVTSPAYLGFTFQLLGDQGNITIKVPFSLLNLTLTSPLVGSPASYFPCKSYSPSGPNSTPGNEYHLGRAFLQAAFIGMNWHNAMWWMAQAPGPNNLFPDVRPLENSTTTIESVADSSLWSKSWSGVWTPLPTNNNNGTQSINNDDGEGSSLTTGVKAGIGIAAVVGFSVLLGVIYFVTKHCKKARNQATGSSASQHSMSTFVQDGTYPNDKPGGFVSVHPRSVWERQELNGSSQSPGTNHLSRELPHSTPPQEMPANDEIYYRR